MAMSIYEALAKQPGIDARMPQDDLASPFEIYRHAYKDRRFAFECLSAMSENMRNLGKD